MHLYRKAIEIQTDAQMKEVSKNSFLSSIPNVMLRGAHQWVIKTNGELGQIGKLNQISTSGELPRGESLDPLAMERIRFGNRIRNYRQSFLCTS